MDVRLIRFSLDKNSLIKRQVGDRINAIIDGTQRVLEINKMTAYYEPGSTKITHVDVFVVNDQNEYSLWKTVRADNIEAEYFVSGILFDE